MSAPLDASAIRKAYVRAPNWLGDVIMATPAFARIRSFLIEAEIVCGIKKGHDQVLASSKSFDRILHVSRPRGLRGLLRQASLLRREKFDLAILFPNSISSALVCAVAGIPRRVGYAHGRRLLITHGARFHGGTKGWFKKRGPRRTPVPMIDYWFSLLDELGMPKVGPHPILRITESERSRASELFTHYGIQPGDRLVLLAPTAGFGPSKLWYDDRWAALARALIDEPATRVLVLCGPGEEDVARAIADLARSDRVVATLPPVPLDLMKPLVDRADLMVTTDSGPRHIAVAFDTPCVVLMGSTHPDYTSSNTDFTTVLRHDVDCGPCHLPVCTTDHRCMKLITVEEVLEASRRRVV